MKGKFVIIILVIIAIILYTSNDYDVYGFWVASEQFLKDANLKSMVLFIDEKGSPRNGYLYVTNGTGDVENQKIELNLGMMFNGWCSLTVNGSNHWNEELQMRICPQKNLMTIVDNDTVYGEFYKDNEATDLARSSTI